MKGNQSNGFLPIIAQAIAEMEETFGEFLSIEDINLAELSRRTGLSRSKLRRLKANGFRETPHGLAGQRKEQILDGYTAVLDSLLRSGVSNSSVCMERLHSMGFQGSLSTVKRYIAAHKNLIPAKRQQIAPQGNRGRRYTTSPGEAYQMGWGFTDVLDYNNCTFRVACFAMICHHCGQRYIEFFPNAKQENLFIGMVHAFQYMGIPRFVLTDNMKSVVLRRDMDGHPIWQKDYENFMKTVGFETKLCKPRHPFTKGKVERLVRFVKDNFLVDRVFSNITDLNWQALDWCNYQNNLYHRATDSVPQQVHMTNCVVQLHELPKTDSIRFYLCPERKISFDGFVNYEGRRFGVPYSYSGKTARISRSGDTLYIYSADLRLLLVTHNVTWSRKDSFCEGQYEDLSQPEEFPTMPVKTQILRLPKSQSNLSFAKFDFDEEDPV
ncbi:Transposase [Ruminococcaceae bacterium P7]|nr:Transposase [Ruminococcaceae bacterium P7]